MSLTLTSPSFDPGAALPARHAYRTGNASPPLEWTDPPAGTRAFALLVDDPDAPAGDWQFLRFGYTIGDHAYVSTASEGWQRAPGVSHDSYAIDVYDAGAIERYWNAVVEPLIADAGPLAGNTLKYLHTDSWEVEAVNWTPTLRAEFL